MLARIVDHAPISGQSGAVPTYPGKMYYVSGTANIVVSHFPLTGCADNVPQQLGSRQYDYVLFGGYYADYPGITSQHTIVGCCESYSAVRYGEDCWPGGVTTPIVARAYNVQNCISARQKTDFSFAGIQSGNPMWAGDFLFRGGGLAVNLICLSGGVFPHSKWAIEYRGCASGYQNLSLSCMLPLRLQATMILAPDCCECVRTTEGAQITIDFEANCPTLTIARHVDYTPDGIPIMAADGDCYGDVMPEGCQSMTCGLVAEIVAIDSECSCMEGIYDLDYGTGQWDYNGLLCAISSLIRMTCRDLGRGYVEYQLDIVCGADNVGTDTTIINVIDENDPVYQDMEHLDIIFDIRMTAASGGCTGNCRWQWTEMAMSWTQLTFCDIGCSCSEPTSPGTHDGEIRETDCHGMIPIPCCEGRIQVRVMRI